MEKIGDSSIVARAVGLMRAGSFILLLESVPVPTSFSSGGSSPVLILSNSDLFKYFLP